MSSYFVLVMLPDISDLKKKRLLAGLTQSQLAKLSGVSQSMIAKIEAGLLDPTMSKARLIASALVSSSSSDLIAGDVVSKIVSFAPSTPISKVITCMQEQGFSQLPVIKNKDLVGFVTEKSILSHSDARVVSEVMISSPPVLDISTPLFLVKQLLMNYSAVLVMRNGIIIGIITPSDLLKCS